MSEAKHTPGPWAALDGQPFGANVYSESAEVSVAWCGSNVSPTHAISKHEAQFNAHLIAAAPDLMEALKAWNDFYQSGGRLRHDKLAKAVRLTLPAIAKAEGRAG